MTDQEIIAALKAENAALQGTLWDIGSFCAGRLAMVREGTNKKAYEHIQNQVADAIAQHGSG